MAKMNQKQPVAGDSTAGFQVKVEKTNLTDAMAIQEHPIAGNDRFQPATTYSQFGDSDASGLHLPSDFLKTPNTGYQAKYHPFSLSPTLLEFSKNIRLNVRSLLLAAISAVLHRYTQQETISLELNLPRQKNTSHYKTELFTHLDSQLKIQDLVNQISERLDNLERELKEESVSKQGHLPSNASSDLPVAVTFVENFLRGQESEPWVVESQSERSHPAHYPDLHLIIIEQDQGISGLLKYNARLFKPDTMQRLAGHLQRLTEAMIQDLGCPIAYLPLLTAAEEQQLLVDWNSGTANYEASPVFYAIEAHAAKQPEAIAVAFQEQHLTYADLNQRANQLAHYLRHLGVGKEERVAVCIQPSLDIAVSLLAIFKAGGVYVPIDPTYPIERLATILEDTQPQVLLTQAHLLPNLPAIAQYSFCLDQEWDTLTSFPTSNPTPVVQPDQMAYLVYTSGTTGKPKGVMASHRNLINYIQVAQAHYRFDRHDRMPAIARFTFSISLFELLSPLVAGGTLQILEREHILDFRRMIQTLEQVTVIHTSPSLLRKLVEYIRSNQIDLQKFQRLKHVSTGGDMVPADLLEAMKATFQNAEIYVIYGCSEISCMGCTYPAPRDQMIDKSRVGKPFPNVSVRLYDPNQNLVPIGIVGEIYFAGAGVTKGYLNREELTQEKFVVINGQRFYRTGDMGRFDADGNLEILGRSDFQIQLRGMRIELGEVELALRQAPGVRDGVVMAPEVDGEKALVAYVVLDSAQKPTHEELRRFLMAKLPDYMVPTLFIELEALPLNINQKVDRRALPVPTSMRSLSTKPYVAPKTSLEQALADIWVPILGLEQVSVQDDFFSLGGHSLMAAQVLSRLQETLNLEISINRLFEFPTIASLAAHLATLNADDSVHQAALAPIPRQAHLPLSFTQSRFWFLAQLEEGTAYNIPVVLQLSGALNISLLERSLTEILNRHEVLRTVFPQVDGTPVQVILPSQPFSLSVIDVPVLPEPEQRAEVYRLAQAEIQQPFNLAQDLPIRGTLLRLSNTAHVLLLTIHHIAADGWSLALLRRELATLYTAFSQGLASPLEAIPIQYADFAHWQDQWLHSEPVRQQLAYWKQQLADAPALLELPWDHPRPPRQTYRGGSEFFTLSPELTQQLKALSQKAGATLFMTLLASFATLLSRHSQHQDLVIGSPIANRNRRELEALQGVFINLLALRVDLSGNPAFLELLQRVRKVSLDAFAHSDIPFDQVVETLQPERNSSYSPLFQVLFVLQNAPIDQLELPGLTVTTLPVESGTAKYDLTLMMEETANGLTGELEYNRDLFDRATIARMVGHFQTLLAGVVVQPEQPIATLPILSERERHQILVEWNNTQANYPHNRCIHHLIEEQVRRTPEAIAAVFEDEQLTYQELNDRANQLAHYLQKLGVGPDVLVGICLERSLDTVIGLLGILKAGGAYVPLDPSYPEERLAYMVEDARLTVLLTQHELSVRCSNLATQQSLTIVSIDDDWAAIGQQSTANPTTSVTTKNLAYTIYTSGSTGKPKGVQLEHQSVTNFLTAMSKAPGLTADDVLLAVTTISFDIAGLEIYLPLILGARVVIVSREVASDGSRLMDELSRTQVTVMQATPITWQILLAAGWQGNQNLKALCGGEAMTQKLAAQLLDRVGSLWNVYGPTETTIWSTVWRVESAAGPIYIGYPIDNTQLYVLDAHQQPVPIGVAGELYIGGDGLARGYLNRPDLTAERFVPNPFSQDPESRLYRTGDLVRQLPDGKVECLGRIDHQVKVRGFRIELGEIEAALSRHPQVRQCVVMVREDQPGEKRLVGYVITGTPDPVPVQNFRQFLQQTLPDYMIPAAFVQLEFWPLTPNGKIDRRALPLPKTSDLAALGSCVAPRTGLEQKLVEIWEEVLNIQPIGIHDNFFDLGGHSLLTVRLSIQIEQRLGQKLPLSTILTAPTIAQLAEVLDPTQSSSHQDSVVLLRPGQDGTPIFLIHDGDGEILLYRSLAQQLDPTIPVYGIQPYRTPQAPILHSRIEDAATYYVQQIREVQPHGPYFLAGMCIGGALALAVAQQLQQQGEAVKMLAMLDAVDVDTPQRTGYIAKQRLNSFSSLFHGNSHLKRHEKLLYTVNQIRKKVTNLVVYELQEKAANLRNQTQLSLFRYYRDHNLALPKFLQNIPVRRVLMWAKQSHTPQGTFAGEILLFRATQKSSVFDGTQIDDTPGIEVYSDPLLGWDKRTTKGVQVHDVPGGHSSMLQDPNVQVLAEIMQAYIDATIADQPAFSPVNRTTESALELVSRV
jgi:amino acid adenylation domain-containing protein